MKSNKAKILYKNITTYTNSNYAKFLNFHNDKYEFSYNFYTIVMSILLCYCIIINIKSKNIKKLVGIGGTVTSVSAMNQQLEVYSMEKVHNSKICKKELDEILQMLKNMTLEDKKRLKGLQPKRADIITAGVVILDIIMEKLELNEIIVSEYDNLEGLMCQIAKKMS